MLHRKFREALLRSFFPKFRLANHRRRMQLEYRLCQINPDHCILCHGFPSFSLVSRRTTNFANHDAFCGGGNQFVLLVLLRRQLLSLPPVIFLKIFNGLSVLRVRAASLR